MTFGTGTASNSHDFWNQIDGYILGTTGWTTHYTVGPYDRVYKSSGESGLEKIYLRMTAGLTDTIVGNNGRFLQSSFLLGDGYSSSIAFRTYSYFSSITGDGYGEAGTIGPILYQISGADKTLMYVGDWQNSEQFPYRAVNFWNQFVGTTAYSRLTESDNTRSSSHCFDGKRYIYMSSDFNFERYDVINQTSQILAGHPQNNRLHSLRYVIDHSNNNKEYIFSASESSLSGFIWMRYDIAANVWEIRANPPWSGNLGSPSTWNGKDKIYLICGQNSVGRWAYYDIPTDTWSAFANLPTTDWKDGGRMIFIKANSDNGLSNDRLYSTVGRTAQTLYYIDLDSFGIPTSSSWTSAATPLSISVDGDELIYAGGKYIHMFYGADGQTYRRVDRYIISSNTWEQVSLTATAFEQFNGGGFVLENHKTFLPVDDEGHQTNYWAFINKDRIAIVARNQTSLETDFAYAGLIQSYYPRSLAITQAPVVASTNASVLVDNASSFSQGQLVYISDHQASTQFSHAGQDGTRRLFTRSEFAVIKSISGNTITLANLKFNYASGARIGVDTQPTGVSAYRSNRIQLNNFVNNFQIDASSSVVPQVYKYNCPVSSEITKQSSEESRTLQYMLWPLIATPCYKFGKEEVRGQLSGVYVVDDNGTATSEDVITFLGNNYLLFSFDPKFYDEKRLFAFGPM